MPSDCLTLEALHRLEMLDILASLAPVGSFNGHVLTSPREIQANGGALLVSCLLGHGAMGQPGLIVVRYQRSASKRDVVKQTGGIVTKRLTQGVGLLINHTGKLR